MKKLRLLSLFTLLGQTSSLYAQATGIQNDDKPEENFAADLVDYLNQVFTVILMA